MESSVNSQLGIEAQFFGGGLIFLLVIGVDNKDTCLYKIHGALISEKKIQETFFTKVNSRSGTSKLSRGTDAGGTSGKTCNHRS